MLIFVLAVGNFVIGMGAFVVVGLLTPIADDFHISTGQAAMTFVAYTATYAVMSPLLISGSGRFARRSVLIAAMAVFLVASLLTAVAPTPAFLFLSRAIAALGGCVTPVAASVAFSAVSPERRGRALAGVFLGMSLSTAIGVPVGTLIGQYLGWHAVFFVLAGMAAGVIVLIAVFVPANAAFQVNSLRTLMLAARDWRQLTGVAVTATFFSAMFVVYAFTSPIIEQSAGMGVSGVSLILLVFGVGAAISSVLIGFIVDRIGAVPAAATSIALQILILPIYSFLPIHWLAVVVLSFIWALTGPGFMIPQQSILIARAPDRQTIMLALNATANYAGTTIGAGIGALVLAGWGLDGLGLAATVVGLIALLNFWLADWLNPVRPVSPTR